MKYEIINTKVEVNLMKAVIIKQRIIQSLVITIIIIIAIMIINNSNF